MRVPSARQVHAVPANARMVAHVERAHMLGRACQDASISRTRRRRMHTKAIAMQGLGVGMGMVQSSASPRSGLYLVVSVGWTCCIVPVLASVLDTVPPLIPPPAWNNQPLPCAPMLTGFVLRSSYGVAARDGGRCSQAMSASVQCFTQSPWPISQ